MMLTQKFYNVFVTQIRIFSLYCAIPYRWDEECRRIRPTNIVKTWVWKCLALIQIRYAIFLIVRLVQSLVDPEYSSAAKLAIFGWVAIHNISAVWYIPLFFKRTELMEVFNFMIDFETRYIGKSCLKDVRNSSDSFSKLKCSVDNNPFREKMRNEEDFLYFLHLLSTILTVVVPYVIPFIFWLNPCEPQFLSSMFIHCPPAGHWTWTFLFLKLVFLAVEIIASQQMVLHTIFMLFTCYYLIMTCIGGYLEYIKYIHI